MILSFKLLTCKKRDAQHPFAASHNELRWPSAVVLTGLILCSAKWCMSRRPHALRRPPMHDLVRRRLQYATEQTVDVTQNYQACSQGSMDAT